jgi:hypothetical protein
MPTIGWIDALRTYNAGMPSWCVPRKGTPGYERVMRIRQGEQTKGFKEVLEDLERKTSGKPKKEKTSMAIDLSASKEEVKVPTIAGGGSVKTDQLTQKMSVSNNKEAMAVVPVNYVAEGGSEKVAEKEPAMDLTPMKTGDAPSKNIKRLDAFAKAGVLYYTTKGGVRFSSVDAEYVFYVRRKKDLVRVAKAKIGIGAEPMAHRIAFENTRSQTYSYKEFKKSMYDKGIDLTKAAAEMMESKA